MLVFNVHYVNISTFSFVTFKRTKTIHYAYFIFPALPLTTQQTWQDTEKQIMTVSLFPIHKFFAFPKASVGSGRGILSRKWRRASSRRDNVKNGNFQEYRFSYLFNRTLTYLRPKPFTTNISISIFSTISTTIKYRAFFVISISFSENVCNGQTSVFELVQNNKRNHV